MSNNAANRIMIGRGEQDVASTAAAVRLEHESLKQRLERRFRFCREDEVMLVHPGWQTRMYRTLIRPPEHGPAIARHRAVRTRHAVGIGRAR